MAKFSEEAVRKAFSQRLRPELERLGMPLASPTQIARVFNQHFPGLEVTAQTVRKWVLAEGLPGQARLEALAKWLGVSAQWLRFGSGHKYDDPMVIEMTPAAPPGTSATTANLVDLLPLIDILTRLPPKDIQLVKGLASMLLEQQRG